MLSDEDKELKLKALHKLRKQCSFGMNEQGEILEFHSELGETLPSAHIIQTKMDEIQFEEKKNEVRQIIDNKFNRAHEAVVDTYPQYERETWHKQETEAKAYNADSSTPVPFLTKLAAAKGITVPVLVGRILAKVDSYETLVANAIAIRDEDIKDLNMCSSINDLNILEGQLLA